MASLRHIYVGWLGLGLVALSSLAGCARPAPESAPPGELEMRVEPGSGYGLVGRFHLLAVEPGAPERSLDFDASTARQRVALPPGAYMLTLHAGARLVCRDASGAPHADSMASRRMVSAWPQRISITPGGLTTARIGFGAAPASSPSLESSAVASAGDPCAASAPLEVGAEQALLAP